MDAYARNHATSYGLTLVAGRPLPPALTSAVLLLQQAAEVYAAGSFEWYDAGSLHVTLVAPLRGRYRDAPPLGRAELPVDAGFVADLTAVCTALPPLELSLGNAHIHDRTLFVDVAGGAAHEACLRELIDRYPGWDPPRAQVGHLHLSAGYLLPDTDESRALNTLPRIARSCREARAVLDEIALVHYSNRTLSTIMGAVRLSLGGKDARSVVSSLADLHLLG